MRPKINVKVHPYEINGEKTGVGSTSILQVDSHWNQRDLVNVTIDGKTYTVLADDLKRAVESATNLSAV